MDPTKSKNFQSIPSTKKKIQEEGGWVSKHEILRRKHRRNLRIILGTIWKLNADTNAHHYFHFKCGEKSSKRFCINVLGLILAAVVGYIF